MQRQFYFPVVPTITKLIFQKILENRDKNENIKTNIQIHFYTKQIKFQFTNFLKFYSFNLPDIP